MSAQPTRTEELVPRPQVSDPEPWAFPASTATKLDNGLTVVAYDVPGQYVVSVRLAVPAPLAAEPREVEGVAGIMSRTMDEGTKRHTGEELAELLERKGIALGAGMAETGLLVDVDVAQRHLGAALELLAECLSEPVFPEVEVSRHVRTRLAEIDHERAIGSARAAMEFIKTYFESGARASRPAGGTRETVAAIRRADVAAYHAAHVRPDGATLVVAGDLADLDLAAELERSMGSWQGPATDVAADVSPAAPVADDGPAADRRAADAHRIVFVDRPGSVQTELYVGTHGPDRRVDGGWAPYPVLGFVLGGSPGARIDAVLREEKGYTYGIRAGFRPRHRGGLFAASGSVRADVTAEALGLLLDQLDGARAGFTQDETKAGVDYIGKTAPGRYATADAIADEAVMLALDGLTTEFTTANLTDLLTVDPARLDDAYRRFVTGEWTVVLVGDAGLHAESVRALGRGEVTVVPA
jgi:predicted Zn-dependent peptidase